jgi:hypothetical protein
MKRALFREQRLLSPDKSGFADFLGFNPHTHILISDGCFYGEGKFKVAPALQAGDLEAVFRGKVFKMLLKEGKINEGMISMLKSWRHSGFNVHCGKRIYPGDEKAMENSVPLRSTPFSLPVPLSITL